MDLDDPAWNCGQCFGAESEKERIMRGIVGNVLSKRSGGGKVNRSEMERRSSISGLCRRGGGGGGGCFVSKKNKSTSQKLEKAAKL